MLTKQAITSLFAISALAAAGVNANGNPDVPANLPNGRTLTYEVRDGDLESPLTYEYEMHLTAQEEDGDSIGWAVDSVTIRKFDENEQLTSTWIDNAPNVASADGLWWAEHADPANPVLDDFLVSPPIDGTAGTDMDYGFEGHGAPAAPAAQTAIDPNVIVSLILWIQAQPAPEVKLERKPLWFHSHPDPG